MMMIDDDDDDDDEISIFPYLDFNKHCHIIFYHHQFSDMHKHFRHLKKNKYQVGNHSYDYDSQGI